MRSFNHKPDNRRQVYLALASQIEGQLRDAYAKRQEESGETQSSLADKLGVHRSAVHRRLAGRANLTIETIADMVWALRHCIRVEIFEPQQTVTNHKLVIPRDDQFALIESAKMIVRKPSTEADARGSTERSPAWVSLPGGQKKYIGDSGDLIASDNA